MDPWAHADAVGRRALIRAAKYLYLRDLRRCRTRFQSPGLRWPWTNDSHRYLRYMRSQMDNDMDDYRSLYSYSRRARLADSHLVITFFSHDYHGRLNIFPPQCEYL